MAGPSRSLYFEIGGKITAFLVSRAEVDFRFWNFFQKKVE